MVVIVGAVAAQPAAAHHGFAVHYDVNDQVRIEGQVYKVRIKNPHAEIQIQAVDKDGNNVIWTCETQAGSILRRKGVTADRFVAGEAIVVEGSRARRNPHGCEVGSIYFADGQTLSLRSTAGHARIGVNNVDIETASKRQSVLGMWLRDSFSGPPMKPGFLDLVTEAGRAANANYVGSRDDPTRQCSPVNPVRAWIAPGTPTEIRERDGQIEIQHEFMDTTRIVDMHGNDHPGKIARSIMGHSVGRFDGESLIVATSLFEAGVLLTHAADDSGVLHSEDLEMTEVYSVVPDTGELKIEWSARDAQYFPEPITGELLMSPTNLAIDNFDCVPYASD
jgi:hypothetical protein